MAWNFPEGIEKETNISDLKNDKLEFFHDQMHVFWKKIEEGFYFKWNFREVYIKHREVTLEMLKRRIKHLYPVNELDNISPSFSKTEISRNIKKK